MTYGNVKKESFVVSFVELANAKQCFEIVTTYMEKEYIRIWLGAEYKQLNR